MYVSFLVFEVPWFMTLGDNVGARMLACCPVISNFLHMTVMGMLKSRRFLLYY